MRGSAGSTRPDSSPLSSSRPPNNRARTLTVLLFGNNSLCMLRAFSPCRRLASLFQGRGVQQRGLHPGCRPPINFFCVVLLLFVLVFFFLFVVLFVVCVVVVFCIE